MQSFSLKHLPDRVLVQQLNQLVAQEHCTTAQLLAHLAEVERRNLHLRAGYNSMKSYCVGELHYSESAAGMRIYAAHIASEHPAIFGAIADGRIHLTALTLLAPRLTPTNVDELIAVATHKTRQEIEHELARRFPVGEALRLDGGISPQVVAPQQANANGHRLNGVQTPVPGKVAPISAERSLIQFSAGPDTLAKLRPSRTSSDAPCRPEISSRSSTVPSPPESRTARRKSSPTSRSRGVLAS